MPNNIRLLYVLFNLSFRPAPASRPIKLQWYTDWQDFSSFTRI